MKHIIKLFLVTFSFCYIGNISRLTSCVKVTNEATVVCADLIIVCAIMVQYVFGMDLLFL
jgi:hypothetical protein